MKKHTLATLAALMAATASAYADDTNYWGAPQTSNGAVNITNYWGIAPAGDSTGAATNGTDWLNSQAQSSPDYMVKTSAPVSVEADEVSTTTGTRTRSALGSGSSDSTDTASASNATWVQTYPEYDNASWVKTYPDHDDAAATPSINGSTDGAKASPDTASAMPTCLDINGSEYCTGSDTASGDGSDTSSGTPLMRTALKVDTTELTGDEKLACEALLCLAAAAARPDECTPSLTRLFSIVLKKPHKTARARADFLNLCPKVADLIIKTSRRAEVVEKTKK